MTGMKTVAAAVVSVVVEKLAAAVAVASAVVY